MKKTRFSVSSAGGANLSSLQAFRDCQKNKKKSCIGGALIIRYLGAMGL